MQSGLGGHSCPCRLHIIAITLGIFRFVALFGMAKVLGSVDVAIDLSSLPKSNRTGRNSYVRVDASLLTSRCGLSVLYLQLP